MAYRDDVEALEARLRGLEVELARQTQERDAAARLLAEAKGRADQEVARFGVTVREMAKRRRRWRIFAVAVLAAAAISVAAVRIAVYVEHRRAVERMDRFFAGYLALVHELCRCSDEACVRQRNLEIQWQFSLPYSEAIAVEIDRDTAIRISEITELQAACRLRPLPRAASHDGTAP